jgi:hypothetical protein
MAQRRLCCTNWLTVEVPCHEPLARQFHAAHPGLDAAPAVVSFGAAFRAMAPAVTVFHGFAFLRGGMTA